MFSIQMSLEGDINLDNFEVECDCPKCGFVNPVWIKQVRLRDVIICRGCKVNIRLDDSMNSVRKACKNLRREMQALRDQMAQFNRQFR